MATFGKFEAVTELHSGERGSVVSARAAGDGREIKYAVKTFNPRSLDLDEQFWEGQSFTERARLQQRTAEAGSSHWAPVYEIGTSPAGTYYVTDFHPLSAASLVSGRVDVSAGVLYAIVRSVVAGLSELKSAAGRAHGNLKASNILINSRGDVAVAGAVLTDPASAPDAAREGEAGDLYALGGLICLLVTGSPFRGGDWPLSPDHGWSRLGRRQGRQWRRLCNDLLSPDPALRPAGLDAVARRVRKLVPRRASPSRRLSLAVAAAVVLVAAGTAAVLGVRDAGARKEVCAAKERWAGGITAALADPRRRTLFESDPDLLRVVRELDEADLASFDCDGTAGRLGFNANFRQFRQTQDTLDAVRRAERGLSPIQWRQLARAAELQGRFEARGWKGPAQTLAACIAGARPGSVDVAGGVERFLRLMSAVDKDSQSVEEKWLALQGRTRSLEEARDPVMKAFAAHLRGTAAASVKLTDAGFGDFAAVDDASLRAQSLLKAQEELGHQYDEARFRDEIVRHLKLDQVRTSDIDLYVKALAAYRVREEDVGKAVEELKARAAEYEKLVRDSGIGDDKKLSEEFDSKLTSVGIHIKNFSEGKFIARDVEDGQFERELNKVRAVVTSLQGFVRTEDVERWLAKLGPLAVESAELRGYWDWWGKTLLDNARLLGGQREHIVGLQADTRRLMDVLLELDRAVPRVPKQSLKSPVLIDTAERKREEVLDSLLRDRAPINLARQPNPVQAVKDAPAVAAARTSFEQWTRDLAELGNDFPLRQRIVTPDVRPDENWAAAKPEFWNDPRVQSVVQQDVERLRALRGLAGKPKDELIKVARDNERAELALHAWRLLGADGAEAPWPTRPGELKTEAELRRRLSDLLDALANAVEPGRPDDTAKAGQELVEEAPRRWRRFAEAAGTDEAMLASAAELRGAFGVDAAQFAALPPEARFNLSLLQVRHHLPDDGDAALSGVVADLKAAAGELKDRTVAADLARRLARVEEKEPFADVATGDEYVLRLEGADAPVVFRRIKSQGRRPFFLATTELSFGQFAAAVDASSGWDDLRALVWSPQPGEIGDPRRGPRSWEWVMRPAPRMYPAQLWLFPEDANDFPKELRDPGAGGRFNRTVLGEAAGGRPGDTHPVQYVTPEAAVYVAALSGCRLPTAGEWRAAFDTAEKDVPQSEWNLRDATWLLQRQHVAAAAGGAAGHGPPAPDEGIYLPPRPTAPADEAARALPHRDGTLFFRPVDAPGGRTFRHLVGNVAEFVCESSEPFEQAADRTPPRVRALVAEAAPGLGVIGASALSPPDLPHDAPQPVKPGAAYADVGFRLAFTAPSRNLAEKLEWVLAGQGFVKPPPGNKTASADKPPQS